MPDEVIKNGEKVVIPVRDLRRLQHDWGNLRLRLKLLLKEFDDAIDTAIADIEKKNNQGGEK